MKPEDRIAGCTLQRPPGQGGMGEVWLAIQEGLERPVAWTLMRPEPLNDGLVVLNHLEARLR